MIYGLYFRFYGLTKNKTISIILSKLAYFLLVIKFYVKKTFLKKNIVTETADTALNLITSIYPDPYKEPEIRNIEVNPNVDLSIIVPVYNYADLINENIESILNQKTHYKYEVIIVDDGSTDGSRQIVESYKEYEQVKVILQENQGIASARNTGINHSSGRYIMFVDCDDTVHDNIVELLMTRAYEQDYDIVMCAHNLAKERNGNIYQIIPNIYPDVNLYGYKNNDYIMNFAGLPWCKVYKRGLWQNVRFFPGYWYEDTIIHFLLFSQCKKFSYIPEVCYEYRWYEKNFSHVQGHSKNIKAIDRYWMLLALVKKYKELDLPLDGKFYTLLLKHLSAYYYSTISQLDKNVIEALFILGCDLLEEYRPEEKVELPYVLRVTEKAMMGRDINLWKISCHYQ